MATLASISTARTLAAHAAPVSDDLLRRARAEYLEMPGLRLTQAQAARLWGLAPDLSRALLGALVESHFLVRARDGRYARGGEY